MKLTPKQKAELWGTLTAAMAQAGELPDAMAAVDTATRRALINAASARDPRSFTKRVPYDDLSDEELEGRLLAKLKEHGLQHLA